jgi:hypothetical protein
LLDNDFFGQPVWRERIAEIRDGNFKACFSQGINPRCIREEAAEAIASIDYRDDSLPPNESIPPGTIAPMKSAYSLA